MTCGARLEGRNYCTGDVSRAALVGVCAAGEAGAKRALAILADELARSMQLCGVRSMREIGPALLGPD